jgi:hypothetical protein
MFKISPDGTQIATKDGWDCPKQSKFNTKHQPHERRVVATTTNETDDPTKQEMLARLAKLRVKAERRLPVESLEGRLRDEI